MARFTDRLAVLIGTGLYTGYSPLAPGTFGSLVGVGLLLLIGSLGWRAHLTLLAVVTVAGLWAASRCVTIFGEEDPPRVVIDEVAGMILSMAFVPAGWGWLLGGFLLFRLFDILKPPPAGWADRSLGGGLGIMVDDLAAGLYTMVVLHAAGRMLA